MEIGWSELLVIAVVALVVIGPKDLPEMFRTFGRFTAKLRSMAREFSRAMEDAAKDSGVGDIANDLRKATNPKAMGLEAVKSAADRFEKWDPLKSTKAALNEATAPVSKPVAAAAATTAAVATPADAAPKADEVAPVATASDVPANTTPITRGGRLRSSDAVAPIGVDDIEGLMASPSTRAAVAVAAVSPLIEQPAASPSDAAEDKA